ncbi:MAG: NUDIX domain-containing protein [Anaerolineales bacterium]|nr:NUDIX domain-containing protein [Anaerolineales bacterium]
MPSTLGVNVAIIDQGKILLTQREDFEVWCLPGGGIDPGESAAQAAVREAWEETGLQVELTRLVGAYSRPRSGQWGGHIFLFAARPLSGKPSPQAGEVIGIDFFSPTDLPTPLVPWMPRRITDALDESITGVAWRHSREWLFPPDYTMKDVLQQRDQSGLSRRDFYLRFFGQPGEEGDVCEVPGLNGRGIEASSVHASDESLGAQEPAIRVNTAVLQDGKVLLVRREDFDLWALPGGRVEAGETLAQAARREVYEESGLEVRLSRLLGVYSDPGWFQRGLHVAVFIGNATGGSLRQHTSETTGARFFPLDALPDDLQPEHRCRLEHVRQGLAHGVAWRQSSGWRFDSQMTRQQIYALRDHSGLERAEFYRRHFIQSGPLEEELEVGGDG